MPWKLENKHHSPKILSQFSLTFNLTDFIDNLLFCTFLLYFQWKLLHMSSRRFRYIMHHSGFKKILDRVGWTFALWHKSVKRHGGGEYLSPTNRLWCQPHKILNSLGENGLLDKTPFTINQFMLAFTATISVWLTKPYSHLRSKAKFVVTL